MKPSHAGCFFAVHLRVKALYISLHLLALCCCGVAAAQELGRQTLIGLTNHVWRYNDAGANPGGEWIVTEYNDSTWETGRGAFARESSPFIVGISNTVLQLTNSSGAPVTTYYFRTHFQLTNDPRLFSFVSTNLFDDGAVVYVNGAEAYRINIATGPVTSSTLAAGSAREGGFVSTNLSLELFHLGMNTIAVEVHQVSPASGDVVMGFALDAVPIPPTPLAFTSGHTSIVTEEAKRVEICAPVIGSPVFYSWYHNGALIPGAESNPLVLPSVEFSHGGNYVAVASNACGAITGFVAHLTVIADTNPPVLLDVEDIGGNQVLITFSEPVGPSATINANYRITNTVAGLVVPVVMAAKMSPSNVVLSIAPRDMNANYILIVNEVTDTSSAGNRIAANSRIPIARWINLVPLEGARWDYYYPQYEFFDPEPNQGTAWRQPGFAVPPYWDARNSPFVGTDFDMEWPFAVSSNITHLGQSQLITTYFRHHFAENVSPGGARLYLRHYVDDGAIFYLNGREVHRFNMPHGDHDYLAPASGVVEKPLLSDPKLIEAMLAGTNVLAVELHQIKSIDEDAAFTAQLHVRAQSLITGPAVIVGCPSDQTVTEGSSTRFEVLQAGGRTFQWQRNGVPMPGETNPVLKISNVSLPYHSNTFRVMVSNATSHAMSSNATLRVRADSTRPQLIAGYLEANQTIRLVFDEPMNPVSASVLGSYRVTNIFGQMRPVMSANVTNGTNVILGFASLPMARYTVEVSGLRDASAAGNVILRTWVVVGMDRVIQPMSGTWQFDDTGVDRGTAWREAGYDGSSWGVGQAMFGANRGTLPVLPEPLRTPLLLSNATATAQVPTYYFRTTFPAFSAPTGYVTLRTIVDDGCIIYLNGLEILRLGMPVGDTSHATLANRTVGAPAIEGPFTIAVSNLVNGTNVIAVEVHQASATSDDVYWAGEISLLIPPLVQPNVIIDDCFLAYTVPFASIRRSATNSNTLVIGWTNPITNLCSGARAVFMLQETPEWKTLPYEPGPLGAVWNQGTRPNISEWSDVTTNTPVIIPETNGMRFYRLKRMP